MKKIRNIFILFSIVLVVFLFTSCKKKHEHNVINHERIEATCTIDGKTAWSSCSDCNEVITNYTVIPATGHIEETYNGVPATCTKDGYTETKICTVCGEITKDSKVIESQGHKEVVHEKIGATCTTTGISSWVSCSVCNEILVEPTTLPVATHNYGNWDIIDDATLTTVGKKVRKCIDCGATDEEEIPMLDGMPYIEEVISTLLIITSTKSDITLPTEIESVRISWKSSNSAIMSSKGKLLKRFADDYVVNLIAYFTCGSASKEVTYPVTILAYTAEEKIAMARETVVIPTMVTGNLEFKTTFNYGVTATYTSSHPEFLSNEGIVILQNEEKVVTITIEYKSGEVYMQENIDVTLAKYNPTIKKHQIIEYAKEFDVGSNDYFKIENNHLVLKDGILSGTFESKVIETEEFTSLVASWAAISSTVATCELKVSVKVNGVWSEYITYSPWGLGLQNSSHDQTNSLIKLYTDEVMVLNSKKGTAIKYTITLKRNTLADESPKLSLVSFALEIPGHSHFIQSSTLPKSVQYDVPKLNQNIVPTIGNSICSATSTTMLLKFNGFNFSDKDDLYEHRYIAGIVRDYGNQIYGNWVYNTVTMGAYGLNAYVARMYSLEELMYHLAYVGPVALSVKGTMTSNVTSYTTRGHLIVATGYRIDENGNLFILCNDPNVSVVACEYSESVMTNTWRNIAYVYEKQSV